MPNWLMKKGSLISFTVVENILKIMDDLIEDVKIDGKLPMRMPLFPYSSFSRYTKAKLPFWVAWTCTFFPPPPRGR
jgi:hypothetical protein